VTEETGCRMGGSHRDTVQFIEKGTRRVRS